MRLLVRIASLAFTCGSLVRNKKPFQPFSGRVSVARIKSKARLALPDMGEFFRAFGGEESLVHAPKDNTGSWRCQHLLYFRIAANDTKTEKRDIN
jgi:hypothetical protein